MNHVLKPLAAQLLFIIPVLIAGQNKKEIFYSIPFTLVEIERNTREGLTEETQARAYSDYLQLKNKFTPVEAFEIGEQITLREYKRFLSAIRKDSGEVTYRQLLPDSTIGTSAQYQEYLKNPQYENYPVVGVSWKNIRRYCFWRSIKAFSERKETYIYRLPSHYEWLAANNHFKNDTKSNFNQNYADWLLDSYYEEAFSFLHDFRPNNFDDDDDASENKRKKYIGNSYFMFFQSPRVFYQYSHGGLPYLSFRCVREKIEAYSPEDLIELYQLTWKPKY